jgi:hypothetical protein
MQRITGDHAIMPGVQLEVHKPRIISEQGQLAPAVADKSMNIISLFWLHVLQPQDAVMLDVVRLTVLRNRMNGAPRGQEIQHIIGEHVQGQGVVNEVHKRLITMEPGHPVQQSVADRHTHMTSPHQLAEPQGDAVWQVALLQALLHYLPINRYQLGGEIQLITGDLVKDAALDYRKRRIVTVQEQVAQLVADRHMRITSPYQLAEPQGDAVWQVALLQALLHYLPINRYQLGGEIQLITGDLVKDAALDYRKRHIVTVQEQVAQLVADRHMRIAGVHGQLMAHSTDERVMSADAVHPNQRYTF